MSFRFHVLRLTDAVRSLFSFGASPRLSRRLLRKLPSWPCQMQDGTTKMMHGLAEITVLYSTGHRYKAFRYVVDPNSLTKHGRVNGGLVPVNGGIVDMIPVTFDGLNAMVSLRRLDLDFEPVIVDVSKGMAHCKRQMGEIANSNFSPGSIPEIGEGPRLVHSKASLAPRAQATVA